MYETMKCSIEGATPLIMHNNERLANPIDPGTQELKSVTSKRKKTDDDHALILEIEFKLGLYIGPDGNIVIPSRNIERMLIDAAKFNKLGQTFKRGILVNNDAPLQYDGPRDPDGLWANKKFRFIRPVKLNGTSTTMRARAIFPLWSLSFEVEYLPNVVNPTDLKAALGIGGQLCGLCDWRPKYGKFIVTSMS